MTRAYGVPVRRSPPLRLPMCPDAPNHANYRTWLRTSDKPLAIDLFSGAGGLSLGLEAAGYRVALAIDIDEWALETHAHNFEGLALSLDLSEKSARDRVVAMFDGIEVDLIAGGPPCQPYSRAGRSKIRSLVESGSRAPLDGRRELWLAFLDVVERIKPRAVVMENVPDMALGDDGEILRKILARLESVGYDADARIVDTWLFGVPQHRQRLVVIGVETNSVFSWPDVDERVNLREAIGDLPVLDPEAAEVGAPIQPYDGPLTEFQRQARKACVGEAAALVYDHVTRAVRRDDLEAFRLMKPGTLYSDLPESLRRYRADIFDDKYNRLAWDDLSRSITAHIAKDGYWYIHPDQHRTLTVREAARIQTFPDNFRFSGTRSHQFAQIGNAVPPSLAKAIGEALQSKRHSEPTQIASLSKWRRDFRSAIERWGGRDRERAQWAYPGEPWGVVVGQTISESQVGWPTPADILDLIPTFDAATPEMLTVLSAMADSGPRRRSVERLVRVVQAVRKDPYGWDGLQWITESGLGPAACQWIDVLGWAEGAVASSSVLRVTARVTGTAVDRHNRLSNGRMELAKLLGDGHEATTVNAAMHRLGNEICVSETPACSLCPVGALCSGRLC
jgi:DNA (cytosine-5)-methyltransferase 1